MTSTTSALHTSDIDLFSDEVLANPYPHYRRLRDLGPLVELPRYGVVALARYEQARAALEDWQTFSSADGVGLNDILNEAWQGTIIASDPPYHGQLRSVLSERLAPRALRAMKPDITERSAAHVDALVARGSFDAVVDLARAVPISIVLDLLGFPEEGRDRLLEWAEGSFNVCGPENRRMRDALPVMQDLFEWLTTTCTPDRMVPGGFATTIHEAAERGDIPAEAVVPLMAGYAIPAMDTTISALGSAMKLFAENPDQWDAVRADPSLVPGAFNEVLRIESPVQVFARVTHRTYSTDGGSIPPGTRVVVLYGSANRDERRYPDPDRFDVRRDNVDHLAFGLGPHMCPGQGLARLEAHAILEALAARVERWELTGAPQRKLGNTTRSLDSLPVTVRRAPDLSRPVRN
ncbi:cytochrome P450 [Pseudonocardia charpentierae]|uniref:Cytochrome P450 n=1 Tax=Pseudonocardia charpentierae TaxID=3075545 RepID=A0ABU2NL88_9PSEU|nr:cytochrome P450 [Pseudonocardia sp. DSM 45834]MDT0353798.1 cytochrome P450 [Pseudonocardia sp. DSM 45834]